MLPPDGALDPDELLLGAQRTSPEQSFVVRAVVGLHGVVQCERDAVAKDDECHQQLKIRIAHGADGCSPDKRVLADIPKLFIVVWVVLMVDHCRRWVCSACC